MKSPKMFRSVEIPVARIRSKAWPSSPPYDPADIVNLAKSIAEIGLLHPIIVAPVQDAEQLEVVSGHRRFQAVASLGWAAITAIVLDQPLDDITGRMILANESVRNRISDDDERLLQRRYRNERH
jgi:ParB family chromosome partitioning protein